MLRKDLFNSEESSWLLIIEGASEVEHLRKPHSRKCWGHVEGKQLVRFARVLPQITARETRSIHSQKISGHRDAAKYISVAPTYFDTAKDWTEDWIGP